MTPKHKSDREEAQIAIPLSNDQHTPAIPGDEGTEVILLAEDDDSIRRLVRQILEARGYQVHEARNGREGLEMCAAHTGPIDLLLTDVTMPELGGHELADAAVELRPEVKVMFMSGYSQDAVLKNGARHGAAFLQKPFTSGALAQKVRETLDSGVRSLVRA